MKLFYTILFFAACFRCFPGPAGIPAFCENLAARKWFDSARFGMFIHWGAFSVPGSGEWVMNEPQYHSFRIQPAPNHF